jgi:hypothetical protein
LHGVLRNRLTAGGAAAALILVAVGGARAQEVLDRVLAIVGGQMITLTDVTAARDFGLVETADADDPIGAILPQLIDRELILAEVERYAPPAPSAEALDAEVRARRGRFASEEDFQAALARSGINESRLRETLRQNLRIQAYLDQRFAGERSPELVRGWVDGLRLRTDIIDLSAQAPSGPPPG